jgi:hypothetical protein
MDDMDKGMKYLEQRIKQGNEGTKVHYAEGIYNMYDDSFYDQSETSLYKRVLKEYQLCSNIKDKCRIISEKIDNLLSIQIIHQKHFKIGHQF